MSDTRLRCAFLVMDDESAFVTDYRPGIPPLEARGWRVDCVPWRRPDVDWADWHAVYIGAPWDYTDDPARFLAVLAAIDAAGAVLVNPLALVHWNLDKRYLYELEAKGAAIVPTTWYARFVDADPARWFDEHGTDRIVIKPRVGANAADTFVLERPPAAPVLRQLAGLFAERPFLIQPFLASIRDPGEYSLFYLGGALSHAIRKVPKPGDFRVQEEHGAEILAAEPDAELRSAGERVMALVAPAPAYARADFVPGVDGRWLLMELELVEPSLYLRMHRDAPARFAQAIDEYARSRLGRAADRQ
ncbi:MAG TPA: hypothetical protein VFY03_07085 [Woeseiaceae bacterium]|nr:hypothetical protein [Woeseiaceae bacterium]